MNDFQKAHDALKEEYRDIKSRLKAFREDQFNSIGAAEIGEKVSVSYKGYGPGGDYYNPTFDKEAPKKVTTTVYVSTRQLNKHGNKVYYTYSNLHGGSFWRLNMKMKRIS